jgi:hypothetical protein
VTIARGNSRRWLVPSALQAFPRHMEVQRECQSLPRAMTIEEMAESVELVSDCEEQSTQNGHP